MIPRPLDEAARLGALRSYHLLDTQADADFDLLTELAAELCGVPYSFVSMVDEDRVWYKSCFGKQGTQLPRDDDYCAWAVLEEQELVIPDLRMDARTADMRLTISGSMYRMYSGVNLTTRNGYRVGVLCVVDTQPRQLTARQIGLLRRLARQVVALMELRRVERELHASSIDLSRLANEDDLTGLKNRRAWMEEAQQQVQLSKRLATPISVLMLDVDHFKRVNDSYGHPAGDAVLRSLGKLFSASVRNTDTPGRLGGEEFALLLPGTDEKGALMIAETLRNAVAQAHIKYDALTIQTTVSIGIASAQPPPSIFGIDSLMRAADKALYVAKQSGRNRVVSASDASS